MPELAEVEFFRKRWSVGHGGKITAVLVHEGKRIFRSDTQKLQTQLAGSRLVASATAAKQMVFRFRGGGIRRGVEGWLGIHLGMTGELAVEAPDHVPGKHDHLVLRQAKRSLVFNDPRMFGAVLYHEGTDAPDWWTRIAPPILSPKFTVASVAEFLKRRARAPIKAVLLMQERFPGIGNWMADEILWRAAIHPARLAGSLTKDEVETLHQACRRVCREALDRIAGRGKSMPKDLNVNIPRTWLFKHRWRKGGTCPLTGAKLKHATIGGRTTCWSPGRQTLR